MTLREIRYNYNIIIFQFFIVFGILNFESNCLQPTGNLQYLYTKVKPEIQEEAGTKVIQRLFPNRSDEFRLEINKNLSSSPYEDAFLVSWNESTKQIVASGTTAVSALFGLNIYLKYYCNVHIAWEGSQLSLPRFLPRTSVSGPIIDRFRYYQNVCTQSYSFAWWDWIQWEKHIDWMALNGINFPLAFTGQELIWEKVYLSFGLTLDEIDDYFTGPAFLAWNRMGNLQKWGGPLPRNFINGKFELQHKLLDRMRSLGMLPILPAFSGNVPAAFTKVFPNSSFIQHPSWAGFNSTFSRTYMLDPRDPLFIDVGKKFNYELVAEFGTDHVYNCDTFNEIDPTSHNATFLRAVSKATFKSMISGDPKATWVLQGWMFTSAFWTKPEVQSYLSGVQIGNLIVLDLYAETVPLYLKFDSFYNHSFIWCMLHNFGGLINLHGSLGRINLGVIKARNVGQNLIGIGISPEGINQNYVVYDLMTELSLAHSPIDIENWIQRYTERRYGISNGLIQKGWNILSTGVYQAPPWVWIRNAALITCRPDLNLKEMVWYPINDIQLVVQNFIVASEQQNVSSSFLFRHDLVDFTRQFLQHMGALAYQNMMIAYKANQTITYRRLSNSLLDVFDDLELVLKTNSKFLLGEWTNAAESWGTTEEENELLRFNSLNQISLWGPSGQIRDYATKQWSGVISNYYKRRWSLFTSYLNASLTTGVPFNRTSFNTDVFNQVENPFTKTPKSSSIFSTLTIGNSVIECTRIFNKWKNQYIRFARFYKSSPPTCSRRRKRFGICMPSSP